MLLYLFIFVVHFIPYLHTPLPRQFSTEEEVLAGARHMVAMQISHDPLVRQAVRQTYYERAKLLVRPTKKGLKVRMGEIIHYDL